MTYIKVLAVAVLLGLIFILSRLLPNMYVWDDIAPVSYGQCEILPGPVGPEDISIDERHQRAFISADAKREYLKTGHPDNTLMGGIWLLSETQETEQALPVLMSHDLVTPFHPHGIDLFENELYVVNHVAKFDHTIEVFEVVSDTQLKHRRTIRFPEMIAPNDVVVAGKDQFYVSNDHANPRGTVWEKIEVFLTLPWSTVVYFDGKQGHTVIEGLRMANGLALSEDQQTLYVAESTRSSLNRYKRGANATEWHKLDDININAAIDNLEWDGDNTLLTGAHSKPLDFLRHSVDPEYPSPSKIVAIDVSSDTMQIQTLLHDDGNLVSGSSAAARLADRLLVGVVFDEQLLSCQQN